MCFHWIVEITTNSAASTFWYQGSTQSLELTQLCSTPEVQSSDSQVVWPLKQKDSGNGNYYASKVRSEGIWPSPHVNVSLNLFPDSTGDNKTVSARSVLSGYASPISSRPNAEKGAKSEASVGCRLFGINLTSNSTTPHPERESACSAVGSSCDKGSTPTAVSEADRNYNQEVSKLSKDQKILSEAPQKDTQNKLGSSLSSRSRTKVEFHLVCSV